MRIISIYYLGKVVIEVICTMYVCICHAVTEKQVRQAVSDGAVDVKTLKQKLGVGSECGRCIQATLEVIQSQMDTEPCYYEVA